MSISSEFVPAQGFHPVLHLSINPSPSPSPSCSLFTLISVPPSFILDRYQLSQLHSEGKLGARGGLLDVVGEGDLEGPVWKAREAAALIQLPKHATANTDSVRLEVPLHMRYQKPTKRRRQVAEAEVEKEDRVEVKMNQPRAFWACTDVPITTRTCPPSSLSSDFSFPSLANSTIHYIDNSSSFSCEPSPAILDASTLRITLPTGIESHSNFVGPVTVSVIWLGFFYLAWTTYSVWKRSHERGRRIGGVEQSKKIQ